MTRKIVDIPLFVEEESNELPPLYAHQEVIKEKCLEGSTAVFCEQGTGKTRGVLEALKDLKQFPILVVCPKTVIDVWVQEAKKWIGLDAIALIGPKKKRLKLIEDNINKVPIFVINYDGLRTFTHKRMKLAENSGGRKRVVHENDIAENYPWKIVIADESSKLKHHTSLQSKTMHSFGKIPRRYILTGTSITHSPLDLYSQFRFLQPDLFSPNFHVWKQNYVVVTKQRLPYGSSSRFTHFEKVTGFKNLDMLYGQVNPYVVRFKKADCLDLPPKTYQQQYIDMEGDQLKAYKSLAKDYIAFIQDNVVTVSTALAKILRLQQITQGFYVDAETEELHRFKKNPKLRALETLLRDLTPKHKVVIWCRFVQDLKRVKELCEDIKLEPGEKPGIPYVCVSGDTPFEERGGKIKKFQNEEGVRVFIGQIQTVGMGVTLHAADYSIYYSQDYNFDNRAQTEDRIHRIGQTSDKVIYIDLLCRNSVDVSIFKALKEKSSYERILDPKTWENFIHGSALDF